MLIDGLNTECKNISASSLKVGYESMSEISFRTTAKGKLSHLPYIFRNPEPLGTEFNMVACYVIWDLPFIEVQIGKEVTNHRNYQQDLGAISSCTKIMIEAKKGISQNSIKGGTDNCFLFDSLFASKKAAEAAMEVGAEFIGLLTPKQP